MLISKDYHALWLNSAALALAGGDLEVDGRSRRPGRGRRADGRPLRGGGLALQGALRPRAADEYVEAMRKGCASRPGAASRRCTTRTAGSARSGSGNGSTQQGGLPLRVWQSTPAERVGDLRELGLRSGAGSPLLRLGYLKTFMDGTLGSQTAWMSTEAAS